MAGPPGALHLAVRDAAGADGASLLTEDTLVLMLEAGPMHSLAVAEPQPIECGLQAVLPLLRVHTVDAHGNPTTAANCEVPPRCAMEYVEGFFPAPPLVILELQGSA